MARRVKQFLTREQFGALHGGEHRALLWTALIYLLLTLAFVLVGATRHGPLSLHLLACATAFLLIGWCQFSLSHGLHEALHHNFFNRRSDRVPDLLLAYPLCASTTLYRTIHMAHHRHLGDPVLDPDHGTYAPFPRSRWALLRRMAIHASGLSAVRQFVKQYLTHRAPGGGSAGIILYQFGLLVLLGTLLGPVYYLLLWLAPLISVAKLLSALRGLCEHGSPQKPYVTRTILGNLWQRNILGTYGFHYHGEHHLLPTVPYAHLAELHQLRERARAADVIPAADDYEIFYGGYLRLLGSWFAQLPWRAAALTSGERS